MIFLVVLIKFDLIGYGPTLLLLRVIMRLALFHHGLVLIPPFLGSLRFRARLTVHGSCHRLLLNYYYFLRLLRGIVNVVRSLVKLYAINRLNA